MEKIRPKRKNLLELVDRLHVEKSISKTLKENPNENLIDQFVSPALLKNPRDNVLHVDPGFGSKISRRVYMLRRSRTTEGGSMVCELCGHLSFKLFSIAVEVDNAKRQTPSQWRRTQTEVVKVCRTCYTEHNSKEQQGTQKAGHKENSRPDFERSFCGITAGRASSSWHFLRRDIAKTKAQSLLNHNCFETEFSDKYLLQATYENESLSDSDTSYEDSDSEDRCDRYELTCKGWVSPTSLTCVKLSEEMTCKPLPICAVKSDITLDMMLDSEIAITRSNSLRNSPIPTPTSDKSHSFDLVTESSEKMIEMLTSDLDTPLDIVNEAGPSSQISEHIFFDTLLEKGLIDYFTDKPANVRRLKRKHLNKTLNDSTKKPEAKIKSRPSIYGGLCKLVTVVNPKKGGQFVNSSSTTLFDSQGFEWRRKDLPTYLKLNTTKYIDSKLGFRQRKKEIDSFLMEPKLKKVVKYKVPSIIDDIVKDDGSEMQINTQDLQVVVEKKTGDGQSTEEEITSDTGNGTIKNEVTKRKETGKVTEKNKTEDDLTLASIKKAKQKKEKPYYTCLECKQDLSRKSYHSYTKETAPLILIKYFKPTSSKLRICKPCLIKKQSSTQGLDTRKRNKPEDREPSPVPSKVSKVNTTSPTVKHSKEKTPPKKGNQNTQSKTKSEDRDSKSKVKGKHEKSETTDQVTGNNSTQYVIVKTGNSSSRRNTLQKLSTVVAMESDQASSDITINGKNFKIDSEFKLNELVKDNENAVLSSDVQKDLLAQLPNILKRTIGQRNGSPASYKIVNVLHTSPMKSEASSTSQCTKILPKPSTSVTTSLPSISLQIKEQLRSSNAMNNLPKGLLQPQVPKMQTTNSTTLPSHGPVKPIQLVQLPKVTTPTVTNKKRPVFTSPLNTPLPSKTGGMLSPIQRQKILNEKGKEGKKTHA